MVPLLGTPGGQVSDQSLRKASACNVFPPWPAKRQHPNSGRDTESFPAFGGQHRDPSEMRRVVDVIHGEAETANGLGHRLGENVGSHAGPRGTSSSG